MRAVGSFVKTHAIGVTALFLALGGTSYAVTGEVAKKSDEKTLYACVTSKYHTLNLSSKNAKCPNGAKKISFNAQGARGATGAAGAAGLNGVKGEQGPVGPKGADGERGPAGPSVFGSPGQKGEQGDTGAQGLQGEKGDKGDVGPIGPTGATGDKGDKGDQGDKGDTGANGLVGDRGDKGDTGANGLVGDKGDKGDAGAAGAQGLQGLIGLTGAKGDKGDTGATGATGAKGDKGDTGATGAKGDTGAAGVKGDKGDKGDPGIQGAPGASGGGIHLVDGNNVTLGTIITSDRDSATVLTSTGYQIDIQFDGTFRPAQIYYTSASCAGTAYLNDGMGGTGPFTKISGKWVVWSASANSLMVPATVSGGTATGESFTASTIDNPACGPSAGTRSGWKLTTITRSAVGLPNAIATPLKLQ